MEDIEMAQQQAVVVQAQQQLQQQRQQEAQARQQIQEQQAKLVSPQVMRAGGGIQNLLNRQIAAEQLGQSQAKVEEFSGQLSTYEKQVQQAQSQLSNIQAEKSAFKTAQALFAKGIPSITAKGTPEYKYLVQLETNRNITEKETGYITDAVKAYNAGDPTKLNALPNLKQLQKKGIIKFEKVDVATNQPDRLNTSNIFIPKVETSTIPIGGGMFALVSAAPVQQKPVSEVQLAPTIGQKLKEATQGNFIKGTLNFLGSQAQELFSKSQQIAAKKGDTSAYYQSEPILNIAGIAPVVAAYSTPYLGEALLIGGGAESVIRGQTATERLLGLGEVGLGLYGASILGSNLAAKQELKAFEKSPTLIGGARLEGEKSGIDILTGLKTTDNTAYLTKIVQPFYKSGEARFTLESGRGVALSVSKAKDVNINLFESGGFGTILPSEPRIGNTLLSPSTEVTKAIEGGQAAVGKVYTKSIIKGEGIIKGETFIGSLKKVETPIPEYTPFIGASKEKENIIFVLGGKPKKLKLNLLTGESFIQGDIGIIGKIKRITPKEPSNIFNPGTTKTILKTKQTIATSAASKQLIEQALKTTLKVPTSNILTKAPILKGITQLIKPVSSQKLQQSLIQILKQTIKQNTAVVTKQVTILKEEARLKQPTMTAQSTSVINLGRLRQISLLGLSSSTKTLQVPRVSSPQMPRTKTTEITPIIPIKLSSQGKSTYEKLNFGKKSQGYKVKIRKQGRILTIGENLPIGRALKLGALNVKSGTQQTFALEKAGTTTLEDINYKPSARLFAVPKTARARISDITFTERRGTTLSERQEVSALQSSRRRRKSVFFK